MVVHVWHDGAVVGFGNLAGAQWRRFLRDEFPAGARVTVPAGQYRVRYRLMSCRDPYRTLEQTW